ncbi:MAG: ATP-binding protein [Actinomycetota bacterium]|nr:ATP-binding protein [Actinomycetota bacterium]
MANDPARVTAEPTKEFFVSMLVRDIELTPAIIDLIDNSVDGARRLRGGASFEGLYVRLVANEERFEIADNCGGISIDIARHYAFRFGRPPNTPSTARSVGQFGVGMKRSLFKLGEQFNIRSISERSSFALNVDVAAWTEASDWDFQFESFEDGVAHELEETGTVITVAPLHEEVAADFALDSFLPGLSAEVQLKHKESLGKGLVITVNGFPVATEPLTLLQSAAIHPGYKRITYNGARPEPVEVRVFAGVDRSAPQDAGWYVFCNGRLVLGPDRSSATVWGAGRGRQVPSFHTQFSRFRGYVFFESDEASQLPWTTTKVGVDRNSPIWRSTQRELIAATRPVIDFLNAIDWERPNLEGEDVSLLEDLVESAERVTLDQVQPSAVFNAPERTRLEAPPATSSIQYRRLVARIDLAKRLLGVSSNADVGIRTFEYFLDAEGEGWGDEP